MRDERRSNKQQGKATQCTQKAVTFPKKNELLRWDSMSPVATVNCKLYIYHYDCRNKEKSSREEIQTSFNQAYGDVKR